MKNALLYLKSKGLLYDSAHKGSFNWSPCKFYIGFDPTAPSLHLGNLLGILTSMQLSKLGYKPIFVVGGATATIGDPSFRESSKNILTATQINTNTQNITTQLGRVAASISPLILNNNDWIQKIDLLTFLQRFACKFSVNEMLGKSSVKCRLEEGSFTFSELAYSIIQAMDFSHLYALEECRLQIGGADQWGNMVAGLDLIPKQSPQEKAVSAAILTFPLLVKSNGKKMGKSDGNESETIWLDPQQTSPFSFFQHLIRLSDEDSLKLLQMIDGLQECTFSSFDELKIAHEEHPEQRLAQKTLAAILTKIVHGHQNAKDSECLTEVLFKDYLEEGELLDKLTSLKYALKANGMYFKEAPSKTLLEYLAKITPNKSNSELRRLWESGGITCIPNNNNTLNLKSILQPHQKLWVKVGKNSFALLEMSEND